MGSNGQQQQTIPAPSPRLADEDAIMDGFSGTDSPYVSGDEARSTGASALGALSAEEQLSHSSVSSPDVENESDAEAGDAQPGVATYESENIEPEFARQYLDAAENTPAEDQFKLDAAFADLGPTATRLLRPSQPLTIGPVQEVVIPPDDRVRITPTTNFPWRAICSLQITAGDGTNWIGTGFLVGARTLITAGHCVYMHDHGGWVKKIRVIPGRDAAKEPYGACDSTSFRSVSGWTKDRKRSHDYGAIILPASRPFGQTVGYFGVVCLSAAQLLNKTVNLSGYPGDKPSGTQWFHARAVKQVTDRTLVYDIDTAGGQSGAPVWMYQSGKRNIVGIHTNGALTGNSATRIVEPVLKNIRLWVAV